MSTHSLRFGITLSLFFLASTASAESLTTADQSITKDLPDEDRPIILTIDGIAPMSEATNGVIGRVRQKKSYLKTSVTEWGIASHSEFARWGGNTRSTNDYIEGIKAHIEQLSHRAQLEHRQFIIIGHSWGSVLAARAIAEIGAHRKNKYNTRPILADQLVTFGSPLNAQDFLFKAPADREMGHTNYRDAALFVSSWKNYWLASDNISGPIPDVATNMQLDETQPLGRLPFRSHAAYYRVDVLWRYIGSELTADLIVAARSRESEPTTSDDEIGGADYNLGGTWLGKYDVPGADANQSLAFTINFASMTMRLNENNRGRVKTHIMRVTQLDGVNSNYRFSTVSPTDPALAGTIEHSIVVDGDFLTGEWSDGRNRGELWAERQSQSSLIGQIDEAFAAAGRVKASIDEVYLDSADFPLPLSEMELAAQVSSDLPAGIEIHESGQQFSIQFDSDAIQELRNRLVIFSVSESSGSRKWSCYTNVSGRPYILGSCLPITVQ